MLDEWGLAALAPAVLGLLTQGYTQDQVSVLIQDTEQYKQRFAGNQARKANGLAVLSPRDYLSVEAAYRQILSSNGMPTGFYDQPSDFADWIGRDVAPAEISSRVSEAVQEANRLDAETLATFQAWHGVGPNDLAAFYLDQTRALPLLQKISGSVRIGAQARREGLDVTQGRAEYLAGIAAGGNFEDMIANVANLTAGGNRLSAIYGGPDYTQTDAEAEVFSASEASRQKRKTLSDQERGTFSGSSAIGSKTLAKSRGY